MWRQRYWQIFKTILGYLQLVEAKRKFLQITRIKYKPKIPNSMQALYVFLVLSVSTVYFLLRG